MMHLFHNWVYLVHASTAAHFRWCRKCLKWQRGLVLFGSEALGIEPEWSDFLNPPQDIKFVSLDEYRKHCARMEGRESDRKAMEYYDLLRGIQKRGHPLDCVSYRWDK